MDRNDVRELHYIAPIANLPSILANGILSNRLAAELAHDSIANLEVQDLRDRKTIPGTNRTIHDCANLYFDAHNPMLSKRRAENDRICILRISASVLELPDVVVTDMNAARNWAGFFGVSDGLATLDKDRLYAVYWTHLDRFEQDLHKAVKCAEVLVPDKVEPRFIQGVYVANVRALEAYQALNLTLPVTIRGDIFF